MEQIENTKTFHWVDYGVFVLSLVFSAAIGFYYAFSGEKQTSTLNYLLGGKKLSIFPVALSLQASFLSAIFILGTAAEVMTNGAIFSYIAFSYLIAFPLAAHFFVPIFRRKSIISGYEYLELRFAKSIRRYASIMFSLMMTFYMGVVLYAPALALSQVSSLSIWVSILCIGLVCTLYTSLGGMKAVVITDAFQMIMTLVAIVILIIKGTINVGSINEVFRISNQGGRLNFNDFSPLPSRRHTFWTQCFGGCLMTLSLYGANQAMIQRYLTLPTLIGARLSVYIAMISQIVFLVLVSFLGLIMYAYYHDCDPIESNRIKVRDQLVPLFVMDILGNLHGLPGLFISAILSAALSTVSSGVNSLAAVILEDVAKPLYNWKFEDAMNDNSATRLSKLLAVFFGLVTIFLAFLTSVMSDMVLQIALSFFGLVGGPLLGVFICAIFIPFVEYIGVFCGLTSSLVFLIILIVGNKLNTFPSTKLPIVVDGCKNVTMLDLNNATIFNQITNYNISNDLDNDYFFFKTSYMWYSVIGCSICVAIAIIVSFSIVMFTKKHTAVDPELLYKWPDIYKKLIPSKLKAFLHNKISNNNDINTEIEMKNEKLLNVRNDII